MLNLNLKFNHIIIIINPRKLVNNQPNTNRNNKMDSKEFDNLMQKVEQLNLDEESKALQERMEELKLDSTMNTVSSTTIEYTEEVVVVVEEEIKESKIPKKKKKKAKAASHTTTHEGPASNLRSRMKEF